jgi:hypothetical protein
MEGKIDENGFLIVKRGNLFKDMTCPKSCEEYHCGDWCALFGEPSSSIVEEEVHLEICHNYFIFTNIVDERVNEGEF